MRVTGSPPGLEATCVSLSRRRPHSHRPPQPVEMRAVYSAHISNTINSSDPITPGALVKSCTALLACFYTDERGAPTTPRSENTRCN